jgi:hypothetical protein
MTSSAISDIAQLWFAIFAAVAGMFSVYTVHKNENRRRLRRRLRELLQRRTEVEANEMQRELAGLIGEAVRSNNFGPLERVTLAPYIEEYIVDLDFKHKLYHFLIEVLRDQQISISRDDLKKMQHVASLWKESDTRVAEHVLGYLDSRRIHEPDVGAVKDFIKSRRNYFDITIDSFAEDIKDAVEAASLARVKASGGIML